MKLKLTINRFITETCEIDVPDLDSAKKEIESLTRDDFAEYDNSYNLEIHDDKGTELTGQIQPFTPRLN